MRSPLSRSMVLFCVLLGLGSLQACGDRTPVPRALPAGSEGFHPALLAAWNAQPAHLAQSGPIPPSGRQIELYHWLRVAIPDASTRAAATETLLTRWSADPTNLLWIETAWIRGTYLKSRWSECAELFQEAADSSPALAEFVAARRGWGRSDDAPDAFRRALAAADSLNDFQRLWMRMRVARMDADADRLDEAIAELAGQVDNAWAIGGSPAASLIWHEAATLLRLGNRLGEARLASQAAFECAVASGNRSMVLRERNDLGGILEEAKQYAAAQDTFEVCLGEARQQGLKRYECETLGRLGTVAGKQGDVQTEHDLVLQAAELALDMGDTMIAIQGWIAASAAARRIDQIDLAFREIDRAEELDRHWPAGDLGKRILKNRAMVLNQIGRYAEAESLRMTLAQEFDPVADRLGDFELQISLIRQGLETGRPRLCYLGLERARQLDPATIQRTADYDPPAQFNVAAARVAAREGDVRRAEQFLDGAEQRRELLGDVEWWHVLHARAELSDLAGDPLTAAERYMECQQVAERAGAPDLIHRSRVLRGLCLLDAGRYEEAEAAARLDREAPQKWTRLNAALLVGMALAGQQRHREALAAFDEAANRLEGLVPDEYLWRLECERSRSLAALGEQREAYELVRSVYETLPREGRLVADEAERGYNQDLRADVAEALLGLLADKPQLAGGDVPTFAAQVAAWGRGRLCSDWSSDRPEARFFLGRERAFAWWSIAGKPTWRELEPVDRIETLARSVYGDCAYPDRPIAQGAAEELARLLLRPVLDRPERETLLITPDGYLFHLPWAALPTGSGSVLLERGPLVIAAPVAASDRPTGPSAPADRLLAIGYDGPREGGGADPALREAETEARRIAELWNPRPVDLVVGEDAAGADPLGRDLARYRALHIATHTTVSSGRDGISAIRLAGRPDSSPWTVAEVGELDLGAELVYLSSCEGARQGAAGVGSFAGAFLTAGAQAVLASNLLVEDVAGRKLAEGFYRHWLGGKSRAAALRAAQLELRSESSRFAHPFYWSFFQLYE